MPGNPSGPHRAAEQAMINQKPNQEPVFGTWYLVLKKRGFAGFDTARISRKYQLPSTNCLFAVVSVAEQVGELDKNLATVVNERSAGAQDAVRGLGQ